MGDVGRETELCDGFETSVSQQGWDVYPEVGGWDLLLVWTGSAPPPPKRRSWRHVELPGDDIKVEPGYQIGVEAKIRASFEVVVETLERLRFRNRPDEAMILVPKAGRAFVTVCGRLDIRVVDSKSPYQVPPLPRVLSPKRLTLPEIKLQGSGGEPSPRVLSRWRIAALKLCIVLRNRGFITGTDFSEYGIHRQRWLQGRWILREGNVGRKARYVTGPKLTVDGPEVGYELEGELLELNMEDAR